MNIRFDSYNLELKEFNTIPKPGNKKYKIIGTFDCLKFKELKTYLFGLLGIEIKENCFDKITIQINNSIFNFDLDFVEITENPDRNKFLLTNKGFVFAEVIAGNKDNADNFVKLL